MRSTTPTLKAPRGLTPRLSAGPARCRTSQQVDRELGAERARLAADLPFEALAAGVAERLARASRRSRRWGASRMGVALAAGILCIAAVPAILRVAQDRSQSVRTKGGPELSVWVSDTGGGRALAPGEPVPGGAALRVGLSPAGRRFAAIALVDADGAVILHAGAAEAGLLPGAFEWTGAGEGVLVAVLDDAPVDAAALASRLARSGPSAAAPRPSAEVVVRPLRRIAP